MEFSNRLMEGSEDLSCQLSGNPLGQSFRILTPLYPSMIRFDFQILVSDQGLPIGGCKFQLLVKGIRIGLNLSIFSECTGIENRFLIIPNQYCFHIHPNPRKLPRQVFGLPFSIRLDNLAWMVLASLANHDLNSRSSVAW